MPVSKDAERRILKALALLIRSETLRILGPEHQKSLRLGHWLDTQIKDRVPVLLNDLVSDLARMGPEAMAKQGPERFVLSSGRKSQIRNEKPCTKCGEITRVAIWVVAGGEITAVECESCSEEFGGN